MGQGKGEECGEFSNAKEVWMKQRFAPALPPGKNSNLAKLSGSLFSHSGYTEKAPPSTWLTVLQLSEAGGEAASCNAANTNCSEDKKAVRLPKRTAPRAFSAAAANLKSVGAGGYSFGKHPAQRAHDPCLPEHHRVRRPTSVSQGRWFTSNAKRGNSPEMNERAANCREHSDRLSWPLGPLLPNTTLNLGAPGWPALMYSDGGNATCRPGAGNRPGVVQSLEKRPDPTPR